MKYLILGYSVAAINAIKAIRSIDNENEILVITKEDRLYSKPLISYYLAGKIKENELSFVEDDFENKYKVKVMFNKEAKKIDINKKAVLLDNGEMVLFDKLLISVGGEPIIPKIDGLEISIDGVFTFTTLEDAHKLLTYIKNNKIKEAVILGGGLIGLKAAEGLIARDVKVKIIDIADKLLANTFDNKASELIEKKLKEYGCEFIKENTIVEIVSENKKLVSVRLKDNRDIRTELLILSIGVRPNVEFLKATEIKINRGILVNEYMQTNISDIYAAGDVAESKNFITEENSIIAIWPKAAKQGKIAGLNMAGKEIKDDGFYPMNSVEIFGLASISFGVTNPPQDDKSYKVLTKENNDYYKKIVIRDNNVVGVILINCIERAGIYNLLIKNKVDVSSFEKSLLEDDFGFLMLPKDFRKHFVNEMLEA